MPPGTDWAALDLRAAIPAPGGRLAMARLTRHLAPAEGGTPGHHPTAIVHPTARLGEDVWIGPFAVIEADARVGSGARIGAHAYVGPDVHLGTGARIHSGARIMGRVRAGRNLIVHPNATIGADGFSFTTDGPSNAERAKASGGAERLTPPPEGRADWVKIHSLGAVHLGCDVEIGSNSNVDAGTIRPTRIGDGTKIDSLVHVAHNVEIGRDCLLCGQTGIAGSVVIGDRCIFGGQTGIGDNHRIGSDVVTGAGTTVMSSVPAGSVLLGTPAQRMDLALRAYRWLRRASRPNKVS